MGSRSKSDVRVTNLCGGVFAHEFTRERQMKYMQLVPQTRAENPAIVEKKKKNLGKKTFLTIDRLTAQPHRPNSQLYLGVTGGSCGDI